MTTLTAVRRPDTVGVFIEECQMTEAVQALAALARECVVQIGAEDTAFLAPAFS